MVFKVKSQKAPEADELLILEDLELDTKQADSYRRWTDLNEQCGGMPLRRRFRPEQNSLSLPHSIFLEVTHIDGRMQLIQRIEGQQVRHVFGDSCRLPLEMLYKDKFLFEMQPRWLEAAFTGSPAMTLCVLTDRDRNEFKFSRLILPLFEEDGRVTRLYTVFSFDTMAVNRLDAPLPVQTNRRKQSPLGSGMHFDSKLVG